ncbi:tail fiber protein [Hymenobacter sp. M29]|uniref:Tail fiber protein n=1 Tax=Hymenobacter mellowenesis TaxID=3063995 RepID=A0ABT9AI98_9BACT|nr:tail fiber protein [Hymenobacter sp. M29]MDO7849599.1 tail fiber protein [Hymenobacter sp. M29]
MSEPFLGEIRIMPFGGNTNYVPRGWARCNGQLLPIAQNSALYALLGTQYGGDGRSTFAVPNLNGRVILGAGQGAGLSPYPQGTTVGVETVTLQLAEMPAHTHDLGNPLLPVNSAAAGVNSPAGAFFAKEPGSEAFGTGTGNGPMAAGLLSGTTSQAGGSQSHENRMPYLGLNYYIATQGEFPQRQ